MAAMKILVGVFAFVCLYVSTTESMYYPPKGSWGPWGSWCKCSKLCGGGDQYRTRKCSYAPCVGKARQTRACNTQGCKVDGGWSDWSAYTTCTRSCNSGTQTRTRTCTNPAPAYGGKECVGASSQSRVCNNDVPCPVHGKWSDWSDYSTCSKTCRAGTQSRTRTCTKPAPANGGKECTGDSSQSRTCNADVPCPVSVQFNSVKYNAVESDDVTLVIVRSGDLQQATTVFVSTSDYTAKKLTDYRPLKKLPVNFQSGQKLKKVVIDIINDKKVENSERFFAVLSPGSPSVQIVPAGKKANIRIDDDDSQFRFQKLRYSVRENAGKVNLVIVRSGSTNSKQTARVQTKDGSAVSSPNGDFKSVGNPTPLSVVFGAGEKRKRVSVNINDDKSVEQKEKFTVILSTNDARATVNDAFDVATVYILDNDVYQPKTRPPYQPETRPPYQPRTNPPNQPYYDQDEI